MICDEKILALYWAKVDKSSDCWLWTASLVCGYGSFRFNGRTHRAHRLSWILQHGAIPSGKHVLHKCDTPACVNPSHLFLGGQLENMRDMVAKGRWRGWPAQRTHCPSGHPYDEVNTRVCRGWRYCRECQRQRRKAAKAVQGASA